jgi:Glycosyltransferase family 87
MRLLQRHIIAGIVVLLFASAIAVSKRDAWQHKGFMLDFEPYWLQAHLVLDEPMTAYDVHGLTLDRHLSGLVPLTYAVVLSPLAGLPQWLAEAIVFSIFSLLYVGTALLASRIAGLSPAAATLFFCFTFLFLPGIYGLAMGNLSIVIAFLTLFGVRRLQLRHEISAGIFLGLATAIKVMALPLCLYLILRRHYAALGSTLITALSIALFTAFLIGPSAYLYYWTDVFPDLSNLHVAQIFNQSIPGFLDRLDVAYGWNWLPSNLFVAGLLFGGLALLILLSPSGPRSELYLISATLITTNLAGGIGWVHHFTWLLLPLALLLADCRAYRLQIPTALVFVAATLPPIDRFGPYTSWLGDVVASHVMFLGLALICLLTYMANGPKHWKAVPDDKAA